MDKLAPVGVRPSEEAGGVVGKRGWRARRKTLGSEEHGDGRWERKRQPPTPKYEG